MSFFYIRIHIHIRKTNFLLIRQTDELLQVHDKIEVKDEALRFSQNELGLLQQDQRAAVDRRTSLAKIRARRELDLRDAEERQSAREGKQEQAKENLVQVDNQIAEAEDELALLRPQLAALEQARVAANAEVDRLERRRKELEAKSRYVNADSRNQWIDQETASLRLALEAKQSLVHQQSERLTSQQSEHAQAELVCCCRFVLQHSPAITYTMLATTK